MRLPINSTLELKIPYRFLIRRPAPQIRHATQMSPFPKNMSELPARSALTASYLHGPSQPRLQPNKYGSQMLSRRTLSQSTKEFLTEIENYYNFGQANKKIKLTPTKRCRNFKSKQRH